MCRYVSHVVSPFEKPKFGRVLSRKRSSSRFGPPFGVVFARRASPSSSLPSMPGATTPVLASSPWEGCCFRFFVKMSREVSSKFSDIKMPNWWTVPV